MMLRGAALAAVLAGAANGQLFKSEEAFNKYYDRSGEPGFQLKAAGATFPERLYLEAFFAYQFLQQGVAISYEGTGSGGGKCRIKGAWDNCDVPKDLNNDGKADDPDADVTERPMFVDFAGSDSVLQDAEFEQYPDLQMYPAVAGAVVPVYNLPLLEAAGHELQLTLDLVARIFRPCTATIPADPAKRVFCDDAIDSWSHPEIVELNPEVEEELKESGNIKAVVRAEKSGTTEIFKVPLSRANEGFAEQVGASSDNSDYDANVVKHQGNIGVVGFVAVTPGAIGYSVLGEAINVGVPFASLRRSENAEPVRANSVSVQNAMVEKGLEFGNTDEGKKRLIADISGAQGSQAWPIVGYTYFVVRTKTLRPAGTCEHVRATQSFFLWFYESLVSQSLARSQGFAPLSSTVRELVMSRVKADMECDGSPVWQPVTDNVPRISYAGGTGLVDVLAQYETSYGVLRPDTIFAGTVAKPGVDAVRDVLSNEHDVAVILDSDSAAHDLVAENSEQLVQVPYGAVALGVVFNFCGTGRDGPGSSVACPSATPELRLTLREMAGILAREEGYRRWSDLASEANPILEDPYFANQEIKVVATKETNELSRRFTALMNEVDGVSNFKLVPDGADAEAEGGVPGLQLTNTVAELRSALASTPYSIGFTPLMSNPNAGTDAYKAAVVVNGATIKASLDSLAACVTASGYDEGANRFDVRPSASTKASCYPLADSYSLVTRKVYAGEEECDKVDAVGAGQVTAGYFGFLYQTVISAATIDNVEDKSPEQLAAELDLSSQAPLKTQDIWPTSALPGISLASSLEAIGSITCDGVSILVPVEDTNLMPVALPIFTFAVVGVFVIMCVALGVWVRTHRTRKIVLISSPPFLIQILVGAVLMTAAIVPLGMQDDGVLGPLSDVNGTNPTLDVACQTAPVLYSLGFALLYSSLWLKTWRLEKIFNNPKLKRIYITNRRMQIFQALLVGVVIALNVLWIVIDPLRWRRFPEEFAATTRSASGESQQVVINSIGICYSEQAAILGGPLFGLLGISLVYGLILVFKTRRIPSEYGEGRYIAFSLVASSQALLLGVPVLFITGNTPVIRFLILFTVILATAVITVCFIFLPKVWYVHQWGWTSGSGSDSSGADYSFNTSKPRLDRAEVQNSSFIESFQEGTRAFHATDTNTWVGHTEKSSTASNDYV